MSTSTFEKSKAQEARRAAIKKQMEAMEAAAKAESNRSLSSGTGSASTTSTARKRGTSRDSPGTVETARRFLIDEDDDDVPEHGPLNPSSRGRDDRRTSYSASTHQTSRGQGESIWSSMKSTFNMFGTGNAQPATLGKSQRLAEINLQEEMRAVEEGNGPAYRPSLCTSLYIYIRRLMLGIALAAGGTYEYTRSRWEMAMANGRGKKLYLAILVILAITIPVAVVLSKNGSSEPTDYDLTSDERHEYIADRIVDSGMSSIDEINTPGTPQYMAFEWIVTGDHGDLAHDHEYLLQRYALAVFFYATHGNFTKLPTDQNTEDIVIVNAEGHDVVKEEEETNVLESDTNWLNQNRWMSSYGICAWHGVECHHRPGTDPLDTSYDDEGDLILLNMTDNNVRGTIPRELFMAHPNMRWLSFSGNGIFGTLPTELGYLTDLRKYEECQLYQ